MTDDAPSGLSDNWPSTTARYVFVIVTTAATRMGIETPPAPRSAVFLSTLLKPEALGAKENGHVAVLGDRLLKKWRL